MISNQFGGTSIYEEIYHFNTLNMELFNDKSYRRDILSGVRMNERKSLDEYYIYSIVIIYPVIANDSKRIVRYNRATEAGLERDDIIDRVLEEISKVILDPSGVAWMLFERADDISEFKKYIRGASCNIIAKQANLYHKRYKKTIQNVNYEECQELGVNSSENFKKSTKKIFMEYDFVNEIYTETLLEAIHEIVEAMNNATRREIFRETLNNRKPTEISKLLNLNPNTVSSHLSRGKGEIYAELKRLSLI